LTFKSPIPISLSRFWRWAALLGLSLFLAWGLQQAAVPAALLLGPMMVAIAFGVGGAEIRLPRPIFLGAQAVIGCLVARAITTSIVVTVANDWMVMLLIVSTTVMAGGLAGWILVKFGALPGTTAAWGSSPGAAAAMVVLAEQYGADARLVAFMQYLRVVMVVMSASAVSRLLMGAGHPVAGPVGVPMGDLPVVPFLETVAIAAFGLLIGARFRIPAGAMLVPMVIGALLNSTGIVQITLPLWLLSTCYLGLGWYIGLGFDRKVLLYAMRAVPQLLLSTLLLIGLCALSAWLLTLLLHTDGLTAYLATSPGGLDSVAIIAVGSGADIPFVLAVQTLRLFVVILTGPPIARLISHYA
jgi:membrane AbrB-like protein